MSHRSVEVDERGREVSSVEIARRGRLVIGMRLLEEQKRDRAAGRPLRKLCTEELRCLLAVQGAEIRRPS